jgi:basic membrane lipoprotein Med (substrate-binding protein (PBP1-ABC) superfamily)
MPARPALNETGDWYECSKYVLGAVAALALAAGPALAQQKLKVGFIYVGPVGDFGWSYQHDQGRIAIEKALGDKVETSYIENVPEPDSARAIEQLARTGHKLIFTTSFGFMEPTLAGRQEVSGREVRARHRLQARQERRHLFGQVP